MTTTKETKSAAKQDLAGAVIAWFEIPVRDYARAKRFYEELLGVELEEHTMGEARMAMFPSWSGHTGGAIVAMPEYEPSLNGSVVYLHTNGDLQRQLDLAPSLGGAVLWPKTALPDNGFFAQIRDIEGNRVGLYSTL